MTDSIQFTSIDAAAMLGYFLLLAYLGVRSGRNHAASGFLIGDRQLDAWSAASTICATKVGAGLLLTYTALAYQFGGGAIWLFVGYIFGYFVFYFFARNLKVLADERKYFTLPDYFFEKFGPRTGCVVSLIVILNMLGWVVVTFIGGAKVLSSYVPLSFELSTLLVAVVMLSYLVSGGFLAVVKTDVVQLLGISLLFILMVYLLFQVPMDWLYGLDVFSLPFPKAMSFFIVGVLMPLASAELWQRVYAVKDVRTLRHSLILASIIYLLLGLTLLGISLSIRSVIQGLEPDTALVSGLHRLLPAGLSGVAVIVFYSAIMSTADTLLFTSAASISNEFLAGKFRLSGAKQTESNIARLMKPAMIICTVICVVFAVLLRDVIDSTFYFAALSISLGFVVAVQWALPRISASAVLGGLLVNVLGITLIALLRGIDVFLPLASLGCSAIGLLLGEVFYRMHGKRQLGAVSP